LVRFDAFSLDSAMVIAVNTSTMERQREKESERGRGGEANLTLSFVLWRLHPMLSVCVSSEQDIDYPFLFRLSC
jgi:hypothetical protein